MLAVHGTPSQSVLESPPDPRVDILSMPLLWTR